VIHTLILSMVTIIIMTLNIMTQGTETLCIMTHILMLSIMIFIK